MSWWQQYLLILAIMCVLYQTNGLLGMITRFLVGLAILIILFTDIADSWQERLLMLAIVGMPVYIKWITTFIKYKIRTRF